MEKQSMIKNNHKVNNPEEAIIFISLFFFFLLYSKVSFVDIILFRK